MLDILREDFDVPPEQHFENPKPDPENSWKTAMPIAIQFIATLPLEHLGNPANFRRFQDEDRKHIFRQWLHFPHVGWKKISRNLYHFYFLNMCSAFRSNTNLKFAKTSHPRLGPKFRLSDIFFFQAVFPTKNEKMNFQLPHPQG